RPQALVDRPHGVSQRDHRVLLPQGRHHPLARRLGLSAGRGTMGGMALDDGHGKLTRQEASDAVSGLGWRYVLGEFRTEVRTGSLPLAADVAGRAAAVPEAQG